MIAPLLVLTGANGFVGHHFIKQYKHTGTRIRALTRSHQKTNTNLHDIEWVTGDLNDPHVWDKLLEPDCLFVNLAYSQETSLYESVKATQAMVNACANMKIGRLIQCSTISVYGRTSGTPIDERTPCRPIDDYGRLKLKLDQIILESSADRIDIAILRPSAIFGVGGQALNSLCNSLITRPHILNYVRSSLFGHRRMHLVPVETVVGALQFLCESNRTFDREIFIVSEDDDPKNNFRDVEKILMTALEIRDYPVPPFPMPSLLLRGLLLTKGRSEIDTSCYYSSSKLRELGFNSPVGFLTALCAFAEQYKQSYISRP